MRTSIVTLVTVAILDENCDSDGELEENCDNEDEHCDGDDDECGSDDANRDSRDDDRERRRKCPHRSAPRNGARAGKGVPPRSLEQHRP